MASPASLPSALPETTVHITTHDSSGKATLYSSSQNEWNWVSDRSVGLKTVYTTSSFPVSLNDDADIEAHKATVASGKLGLVQKGGTVCRLVDFGPGNTPLMHRTQSLDYGVVLEGTIEMELDDGSVTLLKRGDVAVQRGTNHAWRNPSKTEWTRMLFVLQDCQPVLVGGERLYEELGEGAKDFPSSGNDS
ncbi:hypothetical protein AYO21_03938 [Fonsecaea monophora]|uniref:Cupin type-2 domain-containing protein n=1 Tax=Fonsecaea monophora TaxID=254056 RepID=A0A177FCH2_9EURO|nr:hypothetical protein AYO21_03938 [Fonsecaea monophora]KAH0840609.1 Cupin domain protein [Fonsecaea pedrosoi]OAG41935.1 hypothetical protein AYO21_03938 [Fonsecaea monophora]